ncbi:MAG TPA: OmpA family protein [Terriglobales bacterium]|nr:OmpA family protein [Terriglobales bacterium]
MLRKFFLIAALAALSALPIVAQEDSNPQGTDTQSSVNYVNKGQKPPVFRTTVVERTTPAIAYPYKKSTKVDFKGTNLMPNAEGTAEVRGKNGRLSISVDLHHLQPAHSFGPQYLTYVLWAITPDGRPVNLAEIIPNDDGNAKLGITTNLQSFGMIVTAEPYYAVTHPNDMIVAQNEPNEKTVGTITPIVARFETTQKDEYTMDLKPQELPATGLDLKKYPVELLEAKNAVAIATSENADQYAPGAMQKAQDALSNAEAEFKHNRKADKTSINTEARAATQAAEDARVLSIQKKQQERAAAEKEQERERAEAAQKQAQEQQQRAEEARQRAEQARLQAEQAQAAQQAAQQAAEQARQQQLAAQQATEQAKAQQQALAQQAAEARAQAERAEQARLQVEQQAAQQREKLRQQLNQVLQTRETAQGLVANMPDVLFDFNKATLKPTAKERLAKVAGIILAYPDLQLKIDGYTDNIGAAEYNQQLSEERAAAVRDYLISQGVSANNVIAQGFGKSDPIASNATPEGRQQNRRVEMLVSGNAIGTNNPTGETASPSSAQPGAVGTPVSSSGTEGSNPR